MGERLAQWSRLHPIWYRFLVGGIIACCLYGLGYGAGKCLYFILHP